MSIIYIKDLVVEGKHGIHQREKINAQSFRINVELNVDNTKAGVSDNLDDTLDWSRLRATIVETAQNNSFNLIERLAQEIAQQILLDKRIQKLVLSIDKLDAFKTGIPGVKIEVNGSNHD
jgi:FolB domain-containing protein